MPQRAAPQAFLAARRRAMAPSFGDVVLLDLPAAVRNFGQALAVILEVNGNIVTIACPSEALPQQGQVFSLQGANGAIEETSVHPRGAVGRV